MVPDLDIWRVAHLLAKRHGGDAVFHAAMRADELLDAGDIDGQRTWLRIIRAIEELQRERPAEGDRVH